MSDSKIVLRYSFLPVWLFLSLFAGAIVVFACARGYELPLRVARATVDVATYGFPRGLSVNHYKKRALAMTCADCSCGADCTCCPKFAYTLEPYRLDEYLTAAGLSIASLAAVFHLLTGAHTKLVLTPQGAAFPIGMTFDLLFRRTRRWSELGTLSLSRRAAHGGDDGDEITLVDNCLHFFFASGGNAALKLSRFSQKDLRVLCTALNDWVNHSIMSAETVAFVKQTLGETVHVDPDTSYTSMWDDEFQSHLNATAFVPLEKGASLADGRLKVLSLIQSGGLSAVYLAELEDSRLVVLKESVIPLHVDEKTRQKAKELFAREARLLMKLDHPAIARVLDHIVEKGRDYLVLEYVPGTTLRQYVREHGPRNESQALAWVREIAKTLAYIHGLTPPVVHRDLTPDNVVLREDGALVLIDFGAANEYEGSATGTLIGKQSYIAPEQFRGKAAPASDIYALGCSLYFLLTGKDPEALSTSHPAEIRADISASVDGLVASCTEMDTEKRIQSAEELLRAVDSSRAGTSA